MRCDVISVHLGDTPDNVGVVSTELIALIPDGATFVNTARGIVVDETALTRDLVSGRIDAVLDVTWPEVPAEDSPLWTLPNVTLRPHWAGSLGRDLTRLGQAPSTSSPSSSPDAQCTAALTPQSLPAWIDALTRKNSDAQE